jgi:hypothetical protein
VAEREEHLAERGDPLGSVRAGQDVAAVTVLRVLLVLLLVAMLAGTPGLGLETRTSGSALVGALFAVPFLAAIAALIASWRWPRQLPWLAGLAAVSAAGLVALDLLGILDPVRPPAAVMASEVLTILVGIGILAVARARPRERPDR